MICREHVSLVRRSSGDCNKNFTQDKMTESEREGVVVRRAIHVICSEVDNQYVACVDSRSPGPSHRLDGIALQATCRGRREDGAMFLV